MTNKNILVWFGIAVIVLLGLVWVARPGSSLNPGETSVSLDGNAVATASSFSASGNAFDFGIVSMSRGKVTTTFAFTNSASSAVTISRMYTSCMCTSASLITAEGDRVGPFGMVGHGFVPGINKVLKPGEEAKIEVVFDPAAHGPAGVGRIEREVYVETANGSPLIFDIKANVTP
ncbi:MAG: DUF1573 domain-containing protein [Candidatus Jorgensenbacteria bacterium]|nr:DUF1573 domain-containing protein [Candidatus Jorgensenbacteria bacterium]